jgi:hypothetical protein
MKTLAVVGVACVAVLAVSSPPHQVQGATKAEQTRAAAKIVEETLQQEAREGLPDRSELLKPAMEQAPNYGPARWHSGYVYDAKHKQWLRPRGVAEIAAKDNKLAAYRQAREKSAESFDAQVELARWCAKRKLEDQARAHWTRVLQLKPDFEEALQGLGLRVAGGTWVKESDISEARSSARNASAATTKWIPRLEKLRDRLLSDNPEQREKTRQELLAIRDPAAIEAIGSVFFSQTGEMALLGVEMLKSIQSPQAAAVLTSCAVSSPWEPVRQAAATALRSQEKHDYVPMLLDAVQTPIETGAEVDSSPSAGMGIGMGFRADQTSSTHSWSVIEHLNAHPFWWQIPQLLFNPASPDPVASKTSNTRTVGGNTYTTHSRGYYTINQGRLQDYRTDITQTKTTTNLTPTPVVGPYSQPATAQAAAYQQQAQTAQYNAKVTAQNAAICSALAEAIGDTRPGSPSQWWDWWYDDNDVYVPSAKPRSAFHPSPSKSSVGEETPAQPGDCLAAGTPVYTETGPTAVEKVVVGDRVFGCDPETGCLALKPVLGKTVRPEGRLLKICAGGKEIEASGGQVFWVAGRGWVTARDLRPGMQLHTIRGTLPVESTEAGAVQKTFSLAVADFSTFYVGKAAILTHDNTIRRPTTRIVPGLASTK